MPFQRNNFFLSGNNLMMHNRGQQSIVFSLLISTLDILRMSETTVLKFNYSDYNNNDKKLILKP